MQKGWRDAEAGVCITLAPEPPQAPPFSGIGPSKYRKVAHSASTEVRKLKCGGGDWMKVNWHHS